MWKRGITLALAAAFLAFLVWMAGIGQYGTLAFGLGVLAGSFAAYWLTELELSAAGFWAAALGMLALATVIISLPAGSGEPALWTFAPSFLGGAGSFGFLFLLINRYGKPGGRRESAGG